MRKQTKIPICREALTRANDEVQKLLREAQRLAAKHAYEVKDMEIDLGATKARLERLEAEATDAMVQIELLTAKGSLYDEVLMLSYSQI
jgi:short-subunit dehydrogenase